MQYYTKKNQNFSILDETLLENYYKKEVKINIFNLAKDFNDAIFSFTFGISLLNQFIKVDFGDKNSGTFGVSILDNFIKK